VTTGAHCHRPSASETPNGGSTSLPIPARLLAGLELGVRARPGPFEAGPGAGQWLVTKLAVARTVPFVVVSRAPVTWLAAIGSGLPQAP
jgi:hypothetical protein